MAKIKDRVIPGQLSYNDFRLNLGKVVVAAYEKRAHFATLMEVIGAWTMGVGVTILARNRDAYAFWDFVYRRYLAAGGPSENFVVAFVSQHELLEAACSYEVGAVIIDGDISRVEKLSREILGRSDSLNFQMKKLMTPFDGPFVGHFSRLLEEFCYVRSLAVNTMRHGAPLNLDA
ncbi:MAG: hypothetical protein HYV97_10725 [Bdellovibrio sp.]|nr:hypothetical protein [Bdellovibrio sp.]